MTTYCCETEKIWDPEDGVHVELMDEMLYIYMTEGRETRLMSMPSDDNTLMELDAGTSPLGWEDGAGHKISFHNGIPVDTEGDPMLWISVDVRSGEEFVTYHPTEDEAVEEAMDSYDRLSGSERGARSYAARIDETYPWTGDLQDIVWDSDVSTMDVWFFHEGEGFVIEVPYSPSVWDAIEAYDAANGTDLWDHLDESMVTVEPIPHALRVYSWDDVLRACPAEEISADMQVGSAGNSLVLRISREAKLLGVEKGDVVHVTIRRMS